MQNIEINFGLRPCIVTKNGKKKKSLFHRWSVFNLAVVEYEDGTVDSVEPKQIRFVDNKIKGYAFEEG